jgi:MoaA/NifB/PqqE/SkfB family radical SAM enzyme
VEDTITRLLRFRKTGRPRLVCNTTVSRHNVDILEDMVRYATDKGFDEIHFEYAGEFTREMVDASEIEGVRPSPYYLRQEESVLVTPEGARRLKNKLAIIKKKSAGKNIGIVTVNIDMLSEENLYRGTIPHDKCYVERMEVTVDPAGDLVICPFINNYVLGSLLRNSLDEIWNNDAHRKFRDYQNRGALKMCRHCILGVQRNPGFLTALKRIYVNRVEPKLPSLLA